MGPMSIPEFRVKARSGLPIDLAVEDTLLSPFEVDLALSGNSADFDSLCAELSPLIPEGSCVLLFEPTRPDIRMAVLELGARFVDGGRIFSGEPDPSVFEYFRERPLELVIVEIGDIVPDWFRTKVLVDARSQPYQRSLEGVSESVLFGLGARDGVSDYKLTWIQGRGSANSREAIGITGRDGFLERAEKRAQTQASVLASMLEYAEFAGFEACVRAGFLWLGQPGFSSDQLEQAFVEQGLAVFACSHHSYRHRVRLSPATEPILEQLRLIFSRAYKSLVA